MLNSFFSIAFFYLFSFRLDQIAQIMNERSAEDKEYLKTN